MLTQRAQHILKLVIDSYIKTGAPVGSKTLAEHEGLNLSSASIRNVMSALEKQGYLYAPHTSAGRMPTDAGMTVFVDGLLEVDQLPESDRKAMRANMDHHRHKTIDDKLQQASKLVSGVSSCAGIVIAPRHDNVRIKQIEFVKISYNQILTVIVYEGGRVENRILIVEQPMEHANLRIAANYLNTLMAGKTLHEIQNDLKQSILKDRQDLDDLTQALIESGVAEISSIETGSHLIVRGQSHLLDVLDGAQNVEGLQHLFAALEEKEMIADILSGVETAEGVQIYIGAENALFKHSGCSLIVSPYKNKQKKIMGAVGVIGPTRLNYRRVIPVIHYTSELISDFL